MSLTKSISTFIVTLMVSAFTVFLTVPKKITKSKQKSQRMIIPAEQGSEDLFI